jgi:hypothetical protein
MSARPSRPDRAGGSEAVVALYGAAHDEELALLDGLVERAGLGWKCRAALSKGPCLYMNIGAERCEECGATREHGEEVFDG